MIGHELTLAENENIRHCEEHSDEAIRHFLSGGWIASLRSQ
jgi:hypothetical protein